MWQLTDQQTQWIEPYLNKKAQYVTLPPALSSLAFSFSSSPQPFRVMNKIIQSLLNNSSKMMLSTQSTHWLSRTTTCSQEKKEKFYLFKMILFSQRHFGKLKTQSTFVSFMVSKVKDQNSLYLLLKKKMRMMARLCHLETFQEPSHCSPVISTSVDELRSSGWGQNIQ